jgi:succinate-semialdehyde dehydrogenase/glutarate-semialdehyde dehydrogenase
MPSYSDVKLFIAGKWRDGSSGETLPIIDPATEEEIGRLAKATTADLDEALASAEKGFRIWRDTPAYDRYEIMRKAAQLVRERAEDIAWHMTREQGKLYNDCVGEITRGSGIVDWFAEEARRTYGLVIPPRAPGVTQMTVKHPVGPVAAFTPWNFPVNQIVRKLSPALAAGCSIIVKAPEETPASPALFIQCFIDAGVPADVINLVYGEPAEISEYLIPHPVIRKISFTGSTPVGKHLAGLAGQHMKRVTMELGGHAPVMIFDDADVKKTVDLMAPFKVRNAGQVCISPTRFLVQDKIAEEFTEAFTERMASFKLGNGLDPETQMGPLANERRIPAIEALITDATAKGARLTTGGERVGNKGYFYKPTVLADVPLDAKIMNDEPFGPVAIVNRFSTCDDVIAEANRLPFGLASYAFTEDAEQIRRLGEEVEAGMLTINHIGFSAPEVPFGGVKDSGYGTEGGAEAIGAYLETRFVTART